MTRKRPGDDVPIQRKLGYDQMVEMADIRAQLMAQGVTGTTLHFEAVATYEARHRGDPSFHERQAAWLAKQKGRPESDDPLIVAMRLIRDGHNDPRGLAREILALIDKATA